MTKSDDNCYEDDSIFKIAKFYTKGKIAHKNYKILEEAISQNHPPGFNPCSNGLVFWTLVGSRTKKRLRNKCVPVALKIKDYLLDLASERV